MTTNVLINVQEVDKFFQVGEQDVHILKKASLKVEEGDFMIIYGPSGSGKSTLLHILLGLEGPTNGKVTFLDNDFYSNTDEDDRSELRKKHIGMVYQQPNWIKSLNVVENIAFPLQLLGVEKEEALEKAKNVLAKVHMDEWAEYYPTELSSGQQQRVSMARALIHNPMIIVADEPTGNLDFESGEYIMQMLKDMNEKDGKTIIMVTHDLDYLKHCKTAVEFFDGAIVGVHRGADKDKIAQTIHHKKVEGLNEKEEQNSGENKPEKSEKNNHEKTEK